MCPLLFREKMAATGPSVKSKSSAAARPVYRYIFLCPGQAQVLVRGGGSDVTSRRGGSMVFCGRAFHSLSSSRSVSRIDALPLLHVLNRAFRLIVLYLCIRCLFIVRGVDTCF